MPHPLCISTGWAQPGCWAGCLWWRGDRYQGPCRQEQEVVVGQEGGRLHWLCLHCQEQSCVGKAEHCDDVCFSIAWLMASSAMACWLSSSSSSSRKCSCLASIPLFAGACHCPGTATAMPQMSAVSGLLLVAVLCVL
jgi:hypothetical protein